MFQFGKTITIVGIFDPLSALLAQNQKASAVWLSSYSYSAAQGYPDLGLLPLSSDTTVISRIQRRIEIPLFVDIDNGLGGIEQAFILSQELFRQGVAGVCIEDKLSPKSSSLYKNPQNLMPLDLYLDLIQKIKKLLPQLLLLARVEGLVNGYSIKEINNRIQKYHAAGADCVVIHNTSSSIDKLVELINLNPDIPFGIIPTTYMESLVKLKQKNIVLKIFANQLLRRMVKSIEEIIIDLNKDPLIVENKIVSVQHLNKIIIKNV